MADYYFCLGVTLDGNYAEQTCKLRDNCRYFLHDLFRRFPHALGEGEMIINEPGRPCTHHVQRHEVVEKTEEDDPFYAFVK